MAITQYSASRNETIALQSRAESGCYTTQDSEVVVIVAAQSPTMSRTFIPSNKIIQTPVSDKTVRTENHWTFTIILFYHKI